MLTEFTDVPGNRNRDLLGGGGNEIEDDFLFETLAYTYFQLFTRIDQESKLKIK